MEETKFSLNQTPISTILAWVESGAIAIPEIQRPFVWTSSQVRDLMDSLYQGYPVGYIITWQNPDVRLKDGSTSQGKRILIDGQQRITALRAAISGLNVIDKNYKKRRIAISFNPITEEFRTRTSSTERGKEWIGDIAEVMVNGYDTLTFVDEYVAKNPNTTRQEINSRLNRLIQIKNKQIGEIQLSPALDINIVNEIFVRINASGVNLSNADFAMSRIAVYEKEPGDEMGMKLRKFIDYFAHLSAAPEQFETIAENDTHFAATDYFAKISWLKNETDDLYDPTYNDIIRVIGLTQFARGKLGDIVALLSGRNFETRQNEKEIADESFKKLEKGLYQFTNENKFKHFVQNVLRGSGYDEPGMLVAPLAAVGTSEETSRMEAAYWVSLQRCTYPGCHRCRGHVVVAPADCVRCRADGRSQEKSKAYAKTSVRCTCRFPAAAATKCLTTPSGLSANSAATLSLKYRLRRTD